MAKASDREPSHAQSTRAAPAAKQEAATTAALLEVEEWKYHFHIACSYRNAAERRNRFSGKEEHGGSSQPSVDTAEPGERKRARVCESPQLLDATAALQAAQLAAMRVETEAAVRARAAAAEQEERATTAAAAAAAKEEQAVKAQAAAAKQEAAAKEAAAALEAARLAQRHVRLKLKGRFYTASRSRAVAVSPEPPLALQLPAGCRLLEGAIPEWEAAAAVAELDELFDGPQRDARVRAITAGQKDLKRMQLKMQEGEVSIFSSFKRALVEADEARGRILGEYNTIRSLPSCAKQDLHWDYDPDVVRYMRTRKPCSAILGLQQGARLYVYDTALRHEVTVLVPPGAILLFDGDVAHRGASYAGVNTRVHLYLDVPRVKRDQDFTWFPE